MKTLTQSIFILLFALACTKTSIAQSTRKEKQDAKAASIKKMIDENNYTFKANYANPQRGGQKTLTSDYDLRVTKDTIIAFLPYYGRAYTAPTDVYPTDGGIKFNTTKFSYVKTQKKNGAWQITIKPKDANISDWRSVQQLTLDVTTAGYATLSVVSTNRDPISFDGYVEGTEKK